MKKITTIFIALSLFLPGILMAQIRDVEDVLFNKGELDNFELKDAPELLDAQKLKGHLEVGAPVLIEYGFNTALVADYVNPEGNTLRTEIYEMTDLYASYGLYSIIDLYDQHPDEIGEEGQIVRNEAVFIQGKYIVRIIYEEHDNEELLKRASDILASKIESTGATNLPVIQNLIQVLPVMQSALPEVEYFRGFRGLNMIYTFNDEDIWGMKDGVAGIYPGYKIIIIRFSNETKAKNQWAFLRRLFSIDPKFQAYNSGTSTAFQMYDKKGTKIVGNYYRQFFIFFLYRGRMNITPELKEIKHNLDVSFP